jgi:hypothetical protein
MWQFIVLIDWCGYWCADDMIFNINFSTMADGYFVVWHNATSQADQPIVAYSGPTAWRDASPRFYSKIGLYRDAWPTSWSSFWDDYTIGYSFDAVNPKRFDRV